MWSNSEYSFYLVFRLRTLISKVPYPATNPENILESLSLIYADSTKCKGISKTFIFFISLVFLE
jgi:hypothetical protein